MNPESLPGLFDDWLAASLPPGEHAALAEALAHDPDAARAFVRLARTDAELEGFFAGQAATPVRTTSAARKTMRLAWSLGAAAAIVLTGAWIAWERVQALRAPSTAFSGSSAPALDTAAAAAPALPEQTSSMKADIWIYKLRDGTPGRMRGSEFVPLAENGNKPSAENPIVSREAAFTDWENEKPVAPSSAEPAPVPAAFQWEIVKLNGHDYISADSVTQFYFFKAPFRNENTLTFQSQAVLMGWAAGSRRIFINDCRFNTSLPIVESGGRMFVSRRDLAWIIEPVLRPSRIRSVPFTTVVIDAGHGGADSGAAGLQDQEKVYTLNVAQRLEKKLTEAGLKVVMTRKDDSDLKISERSSLANAASEGSPGAAILVSIHFHAGPPLDGNSGAGKASLRGAETFVYNDFSPETSPADPEHPGAGDDEGSPTPHSGEEAETGNSNLIAPSMALATAVHANLDHMLRGAGSWEKDRGVSGAKFALLRNVKIPAILVSPGSLTDPREAGEIADPAWRDKCAEAICTGILNCRKAFAPERK